MFYVSKYAKIMYMTTIALENNAIRSTDTSFDWEGYEAELSMAERLEEARADVAAIYAREMRLGPIEGDEEREEAIARHRDLMVICSIEKLGAETTGLDDVEKNARVLEYLFTEQKLVRQQVDGMINDDVIYRARRAIGEFFGRGGKLAQTAKKMAVSAFAGVVGGLVGGAAGAALGVGVSRGVQVMATHRFESLAERSAGAEDLMLEGETPTERLQSLFAQMHERLDVDVAQERKGYWQAMGRATRSGVKAGVISLVAASVVTGDIGGGTVAHADTGGVGYDGASLEADLDGAQLDIDDIDTGTQLDVDEVSAGTQLDVDSVKESGVQLDVDGDEVGVQLEVDEDIAGTRLEVDEATGAQLETDEAAGVQLDIDSIEEGGAQLEIDGDSTGTQLEVDDGSVGGATKAPLVIDPNRIDDLPTPGADVPGLPLAPEPELPGLPPAPEVDLSVFDFGYGTATEHLLQDVASEQLGVKLDGREAYLLINHLMEETGGKVFEGVDTVFHGPGDVWIMNPGGETSGLTADALKVAQEWLDMGRPGLPKAGV